MKENLILNLIPYFVFAGVCVVLIVAVVVAWVKDKGNNNELI